MDRFTSDKMSCTDLGVKGVAGRRGLWNLSAKVSSGVASGFVSVLSITDNLS